MDNIEPTSSIADSLDLTEDSSDAGQSLDSFNLESKGAKILSQFQQMQQQYSTQITTDAFSSLLSTVSNKEEYLRNIASKIYEEVHKAAKKYLKTWCAVNRMRQKWASPFEKLAPLKANSPFIPQVYTLSIVSVDNGNERTLAYMAKTPREASINAAKLIGFDSSNERKLALSKFPPDVLESVFANPAYLREAEALYVYEEHRRQVENRKYTKSYIREAWSKEIDEEFAKKNGVI